ncbi:MAG: hypothetical protein WCS96_12435 [Victivallales bacterium]
MLKITPWSGIGRSEITSTYLSRSNLVLIHAGFRLQSSTAVINILSSSIRLDCKGEAPREKTMISVEINGMDASIYNQGVYI